MSTIVIHLHPGSRVVNGRELGTLRSICKGEPRKPWPCFIVAKVVGGSGRTRREVRS